LNINNLGYRYVVPGAPSVAAAPAAEALAVVVAPKPVDFANLPIVARIENVPSARINTPVSVPVNLQPPQTNTLESIGPFSAAPTVRAGARTRAPTQAQAQRRVLALIKNVEPPKNGNAEVRVFVNHPDLKPDTPEQDRHFAGSFTFFGAEHAEHGGKFSFVIDLTDTIRRLNIAEVHLKQLNIQLMPVPIPGVSSQDLEIKPGSIEIAIV
jgi:tyrosinase